MSHADSDARGWRGQHTVIVTDAQAMGSVGVIRSLGRAGYRVVAASPRKDAIGLRSKFVARPLERPQPLAAAADRFADWLADVVRDEHPSAIVASEGALLAIRHRFERFSKLLPWSSDPRIVYEGMSKCELFRAFRDASLDSHLPRFLLVDRDQPAPSLQQLEDLGLPCFVKADASLALDRADSAVVRCTSAAEAAGALETLRGGYRSLLVQGFAPGIGVGAFLLRSRGRLLAQFMHRRIHEVPHTGGASSFREAWWHDAIMRDAIRRAEALDWEGVAMFEYRWDPATDGFQLLELNGRFWGSLHLALYAGVDFPRLLIDAFLGHAEVCAPVDSHLRCRWTFPREVEYVRSRLRDGDIPLPSRLYTLAEFFLLGFDLRVRSDLLFPGDRALYWIQMRQSFRNWFGF